ncbi:MAG: chromosome partitioning protein ParB [Rhodospirillales bacterium]|nr:chromosome partitioning protein ParB [Rhodospirillales bacterium]
MAEEGKPRKLGRGLSALFGEESESDAEAARKPSRTIAIGQIHPGRYQPRRVFDDEKLAGLVDSIRDKGILSPLLVRVHPTIQNAYELIAGERRWRAAQKARLHDVPVIVRDLTDRETLEIALVENLQREDLNALEEAEAYARLTEEFGHTQDELAKAVGKSRSHVANTMRLLGLGQKVRGLLTQGKLSAGHARALLGVEGAEVLADEIVERGLNVRQVEALVQKGRKSGSARPSSSGAEPDADILALERELTGSLGLAVKIRSQGSGGDVVISYRTLDQLDHLLKRLR